MGTLLQSTWAILALWPQTVFAAWTLVLVLSGIRKAVRTGDMVLAKCMGMVVFFNVVVPWLGGFWGSR